MKKINENTFQISENLFIKNYNENNNNLTVFNTLLNDNIFFLIYNNNDLYKLNIKDDKLEYEKIEEINQSNINLKEISFTKNNFFFTKYSFNNIFFKI